MIDTPVAEWRVGWLRLEVASLLNNPAYLIMTYEEKLERGFPATQQEMIDYIEADRKTKEQP